MYRSINILLFFILLGCSPAKVKENVTLHDRPVSGTKVDSRPKASDESTEASVVRESTMNPKENKADSMMIEKGENIYRREGFSDSGSVEKILEFLASDDLKGRDTGSEGIEKAAEYIQGVFKENKVAPYFSDYRDELSNFEKPAYNIVGLVEGSDKRLKNEFIIIGAHYDHIGIVEGEKSDTIANGANDNASGTTTVLELARYFGNARTNKRSIIFALFSGEEKGLLGSQHLAKKLKEQNLNLYVMLNFEMVGVPLVGKNYFMYVTGFEESNLAGVGNMFVGSNLIGFLPKAKEFNLFKRSDNYSFHTEFNVPSQTFSTFDFTNFDQYHKVGDEAKLMDFQHLAKVVNKSIPLIEDIANSMTKMIKYN